MTEGGYLGKSVTGIKTRCEWMGQHKFKSVHTGSRTWFDLRTIFPGVG